MPDPEFTLEDDFPPVSYEEWRALAEADLEGASFAQKLITRTYEGIDIQPLYTRRDQPGADDPAGYPGLPLFVRGSHPLGQISTGWDLRQEHAHPDLAAANRAIRDDVAGGVTSLLLRLDAAARSGRDPGDPAAADLCGRDGLMAYQVDDLDAALAGVDLNVTGVALEAGAAFLPAAATLTALWRRRGVSPQKTRGAFHADPWAVLAGDGYLPVSPSAALAQMADLAAWTGRTYPHVTAVRVDTAPYHHAGATAVQDLAFGIATAVEYLRGMTGAGLTVDDAARQILFGVCVGTRHFQAIAKLRAARRLWGRVISACGGSPSAGAMRMHARVSDRVLTRRDPYVNLLRNTVAVFAAALGGAETITSVAFDNPAGPPEDFSRRIARNTLLILQEEAHLGRVVDPAGGSWFLERLTEQIADEAWGVFQEVERRGGMLHALQDGWVAEQIELALAPRIKNIARRKDGITGVSEFPNLDEPLIAHPPPDRAALHKSAMARIAAARRRVSPARLDALRHETASWGHGATTAALVEVVGEGASLGQVAGALGFHQHSTTMTPLTPRPFAQPFEELRDASDAWRATHGVRPRVFLANLGLVSHYTARATFSKNFFEAGGFEVIGHQSFVSADAVANAFKRSQATVAVICSSDKYYPELVPQVAPKLKEAGARCVVLAGHPGPHEAAWRAAGVDRFIFVKCDVLATLRDLLGEQGVLPR